MEKNTKQTTSYRAAKAIINKTITEGYSKTLLAVY